MIQNFWNQQNIEFFVTSCSKWGNDASSKNSQGKLVLRMPLGACFFATWVAMFAKRDYANYIRNSKSVIRNPTKRLKGYRTFSLKSICTSNPSGGRPPSRRFCKDFSCLRAEIWCHLYASRSSMWDLRLWRTRASSWCRFKRTGTGKAMRAAFLDS